MTKGLEGFAFFVRKIKEAQNKELKNLGRLSPDRNPDTFTIGDFIDSVFSIKKKDEMKLFYEGSVYYLSVIKGKKPGEAEAITKSNIGWCFGEGMSGVMIHRWNEAVGASHPVFGKSIPSASGAFAAGVKLGKASKAKKRGR